MKTRYMIQTCLPNINNKWFGDMFYGNKRTALSHIKRFRKNHDNSNSPELYKVKLRLTKITHEVLEEL